MNPVDLYSVQFWWFVGHTILVMVPLAIASARKWAFAGLNWISCAGHVAAS